MGVKNVNQNQNVRDTNYVQIASGQPKWASINKHNHCVFHAALTVEYTDTDNANPVTEFYQAPLSGIVIGFHTAGYNTIRVDQGPAPATVWVWGAGGGYGGSGGPDGGGGAGHGIRGGVALDGPYVAIVGRGGFGFDNPSTATGSLAAKGWPDGGLSYWNDSTGKYGFGGGRSSFGAGPIPYANRDSGSGPTAVSYLLIGGGGGGGSAHMDSGTIAGQGGSPSGSPGGGYYPADGSSAIGGGGTQSAGGEGGTGGRNPDGVDGDRFFGGPGGTSYGGSGGGGGYFGGGGAAGFYAGGGGGSSHVAPGPAVSGDAALGQPNYYTAGDDPANPGTKPATAGDGGKVAYPAPSTNPVALGGPGGSDGCPGYIQITFN